MKRRRDLGYVKGLDEYELRLQMIVPNIQRLQAASRQRGIEVIFTRLRGMTKDGRDCSRGHKELGYLFPPNSKETEILEELAPMGDEMVFDKTAGSVFNATNLHYVLQNMDIRNLVLVGVMTAGCVESAARDAKDLGYRVIVVEDCCAAYTQEQHENSIRVMRETYAKIKTTAEVLSSISSPVLKGS